MASPGDLPRRVVVTVLVLGGLCALREVPVPGVLSAVAWGPVETSTMSLVVLGIAPWMTAALFVEVGALCTDRWRAMRVGGPEDRAALERMTARLWVVVAAIQAFAVAVSFEGFEGLVPEPGLRFRAIVMASLIGGSALHVLGARLITRHGVGHGFALLLGVQALTWGIPALRLTELFSDTGHESVLWVFLAMVGTVWLSFRMLGTWTPGTRLPRSASGLGAGTVAWFVLGRLPLMGVEAPAWVALPLAFVFAAVAALFFHLPWNVAAATGATEEEAKAALWWSLPGSFALVAVVELTWIVGERFAPAVVYTEGVALLTAIGLDLRAELRARREHGELAAVWPLHRVYVVPPLMDALTEAGIPATVRGVHVRPLYHFGAPYLPMEVMVPAARAEEARALIAAWRPPAREEPPAGGEGSGSTERVPLPESWLREAPPIRR